MNTLRLFIALPMPPSVLDRLGELSSALQRADADVRWERVEKMHATIKFLGDTPADRIPVLESVLDRVASSTPPPATAVSGIGAFPSLRSPRILWVGLEDTSGTLRMLHQAIDDHLAAEGFAREERAFQPHITLGRVRSQRGLGRLLAMVESRTFERQPVQLHDVLLVKSELKSHGSVYSTLHAAAFVGNQSHHR